jgi:hypothetical protein
LFAGGLDQFERNTILCLTNRSEEAVISQLAATSRHHFREKPAWALSVLSELKPTGERSTAALLEALGHITAIQPDAVSAERVGRCLGNMGERLLTGSFGTPHLLRNLAHKFPKQVYEHVRNLLNHPPTAELAGIPLRYTIESLSLGTISEPDYLAREIKEQWARALAGGPGAEARLILTRLLIWSDPSSAVSSLRSLIDESRISDHLQLATKLVAVPGSSFVFQFPDLVRLLLTRGKELQTADAIQRKLYESACGGSRHFVEGELDPQYRYIAEQGQDLANRYRDDPVLGTFYQLIVKSERLDLERYRRAFGEEDDESAWSAR